MKTWLVTFYLGLGSNRRQVTIKQDAFLEGEAISLAAQWIFNNVGGSIKIDYHESKEHP